MNWVLAHLIGDYIIQTDWMAVEKKKSSAACLIHVIVYLIPFLFVIDYPRYGSQMFEMPVVISWLAWHLTWWQIALIGVQHFIQDRTNFVVWLMKAKGSEAFSNPPCGPWSIIVTDNIIHILWIALVLALK